MPNTAKCPSFKRSSSFEGVIRWEIQSNSEISCKLIRLVIWNKDTDVSRMESLGRNGYMCTFVKQSKSEFF